MEPCPRCGLPFDSVHAAGQHAWKQQDDAHEDVESLDEGLLLIAENGNADGKLPDDGGEESPSPNGAETVIEDGADTVVDDGTETVADGGNPALDAPDPDPDAVVTDGGDPSDDEPECPECGGNRYFDASEHTDYAYGCADCSGEESWVVFDE
jgi:hypothetical protein